MGKNTFPAHFNEVIFINEKIEKYKQSLKGKNVSVCGIGISNIPLIDFLLDSGANVTARDMREIEKLGDIAKELEAKNVKLICGENYLENIEEKIIFRSPGLRPDKPGLIEAIQNGAYLTSEMQVFFELCPCKKIAVTGSDGKTTTTTLISEILKAAGKKVWLGGNIGKPLLPDVKKMKEEDYAVIELSSFQLMTMKSSPETCVITNISPNHLDWHKNFDEYVNSKKNIYLNRKDCLLITNSENEFTLGMAKEQNGKQMMFSSKGKADIYEENGFIICNGEKIVKTDDILLPGRHNVENYMAAIGATYGIADKIHVEKVAKTFKGVEHRLEFVRELNGVKFYNGSIDSTPTRTMAAIGAFTSRNLVLICGGYDKKLDYSPLAKVIGSKAKAVVLTGGCAEKIKNAFLSEEAFTSSGTKLLEESDFEKAVKLAAYTAQKGDIVLLSPAAASFDRFKNFEERGKKFKEIINNYPEF